MIGDLTDYLVLFDIDGTLVVPTSAIHSPGIQAMNAAAEELTGTPHLADRIDFAGATDLGVAKDVLQTSEHVVPSRERQHAFLDAYRRHLKSRIAPGDYVALGSCRDTIPALRHKGCIVGLGTGNIRTGAALKLKSAGIDDLFDLNQGGYGDDAACRAKLLAVAQERCDPSLTRTVVVIGDTARDVDAARTNHFLSIGITNAASTEAQLLAAGAHAVSRQIDRTLETIIAQLPTK